VTKIFDLTRGTSPLIISMPHSGEDISPCQDQMTAPAKCLPDCDWHLSQLYAFLSGLGVTWIKANYARYVIDLNRDPSGKSLYPGQSVTELCPTTTFAEQPVYLEGQNPSAAEITRRVETYWKPYHAALETEIVRVKAIHGYVILWDAHSILSRVPRFFEGRLPDLNFGTHNDATCAPALSALIMETTQKYTQYKAVLNGRFKGGYITRHYGKPTNHVHAVQLELSQITYMLEQYPFTYLKDKAHAVGGVIEALVKVVATWKPENISDSF